MPSAHDILAEVQSRLASLEGGKVAPSEPLAGGETLEGGREVTPRDIVGTKIIQELRKYGFGIYKLRRVNKAGARKNEWIDEIRAVSAETGLEWKEATKVAAANRARAGIVPKTRRSR